MQDPQSLTTWADGRGDWKRLSLLSPWSCCSLTSQSLKSKTLIFLEPTHLACVPVGLLDRVPGDRACGFWKAAGLGWCHSNIHWNTVPVFQRTVYCCHPPRNVDVPKKETCCARGFCIFPWPCRWLFSSASSLKPRQHNSCPIQQWAHLSPGLHHLYIWRRCCLWHPSADSVSSNVSSLTAKTLPCADQHTLGLLC